MPARATRLCLVVLTLAAFTIGCADDDKPPTVVTSNAMVAAIATTALGDDAVVETASTTTSSSIDGKVLDQLAAIPFGQGPQWLSPPTGSTDAPPLGSPDPAFWLDPDRVVQAARLVADSVELDDAAQERTDERLAELRETMRRADEAVQALLLDLPPEPRVVATNNTRLGYFAERYGLQILPAEGSGPIGDLDLDRLGPPGSPTATVDGLIVEVARRIASPAG